MQLPVCQRIFVVVIFQVPSVDGLNFIYIFFSKMSIFENPHNSEPYKWYCTYTFINSTLSPYKDNEALVNSL